MEGKLDDVRAQVACTQATDEALRLAIQARDSARSLGYIHCNATLMASQNVQSMFSVAFQRSDFKRNKPFLDAMRAGGVGFVHDFPKPYMADFTHYIMLTPTGAALKDASAEMIDWILVDSKPTDLEKYDNLLEQAVMRLEKRNPPAGYYTAADFNAWPEQQATLQKLVKAGLPTSHQDYEAYRIALRNVVYDSVPGANGKLVDGLANYWATIATIMAPQDREKAHQVRAKVMQEVLAPRVKGLDQAVASLSSTIEGPTVAVLFWRNDGSTGYVEKPRSAVKDSDVIADPTVGLMERMQSGGSAGTATYGQLREKLATLRARKKDLDALATTEVGQ